MHFDSFEMIWYLCIYVVLLKIEEMGQGQHIIYPFH